jgi:hypothetical protein
MVDNFKIIEEYIAKQSLTWKEGDCYYVQLLRRQADDPMIGGVKDKKYHGNMHSRSIKDYLIRSVDHLEDVKQQIIEFCKLENVRAYIRLNKRNYKNIALEMLKHIAEQAASGETFSSPFHLVSSACGQCCQAGDDKTWIVDLDKEYLPYEAEIIDIICQCQPHNKRIEKCGDKAKYIKENFFVVPTKSGKHIVCKPFNKQMFGEFWATSSMKDMKVLDIHKDNPTILYVP